MSKFIHPLHTACKKCVFAKYTDKTQIGCGLDYLDIYKNRGVEILEAYDSDLEFFVVNEKKCPGYREYSWLIKNGLETNSDEERISVFRKQNKIGYLLVIDYKLLGDDEDTFNRLKLCLSEVDIKPQKIIFVRHHQGSEYSKYYNIQALMTGSNTDCAWRIQTMVNEELSHNDILHSIINLNKPYRFICDIKSLPTNLNTVVNKAQQIVCDQVDQFKVLVDVAQTSMIFSGGVYRFSLAENGEDILANHSNYTIVQ